MLNRQIQCLWATRQQLQSLVSFAHNQPSYIRRQRCLVIRNNIFQHSSDTTTKTPSLLGDSSHTQFSRKNCWCIWTINHYSHHFTILEFCRDTRAREAIRRLQMLNNLTSLLRFAFCKVMLLFKSSSIKLLWQICWSRLLYILLCMYVVIQI